MHFLVKNLSKSDMCDCKHRVLVRVYVNTTILTVIFLLTICSSIFTVFIVFDLPLTFWIIYYVTLLSVNNHDASASCLDSIILFNISAL